MDANVNAYATHRLLAAQADRLAEDAERARLARDRAASDSGSPAAALAAETGPEAAGALGRLRFPRWVGMRAGSGLRHAHR